MNLQPRMAFRCMEQPRHIHIPLFDPTSASDDLLLVNFTTLRESCVDDTCILGPLDYAELTHETTVAYSRSLIGKKSLFVRAISKQLFVRLDDLPERAWQKILRGAQISPELSELKKNLLPAA
jgi:hypothetical protein